MSGRTIDERYEGQTIFMVGITNHCSHGNEAEWFIHKEKDKLKMRKMCATQKSRHVGSHDV